MQPHSISAMAVVKHILANKYGEFIPASAEVQIEWTFGGKTKYIFHNITDIKPRIDANHHITHVEVTVKTTDGSQCTITVKRVSSGEFKQGERLVATHSVQHVAGLEEHYELSRKSIRGIHRRSWKYGDYQCTDAGEGSFILYCAVRVGNTSTFKKVPYKVTIRPRGEIPVNPVVKITDAVR